MTELVTDTRSFKRQDLDEFIDHTLARAKNDRKQYEAASVLTFKRNHLKEVLDAEEAEIINDTECMSQLESTLKENLSILGVNINSLQIRLAKLG